MQTSPMGWMSVRCSAFSVGCLTHVISPGICAMNYVGDDPCPNPDTPGLIVDDVSRREHPIFACRFGRLFS